MTLTASDRATLDRAGVLQTIGDWAMWRDTEQWDRLRSVYAPEATMAVSWFSGTASDFVTRCETMNKAATKFFFVKCDIYNRAKGTTYNFYLENITKTELTKL